MSSSRRQVVLAACLAVMGCARAAKPFSIASFMTPDRHPDPDGAAARCAKGLEGLARVDAETRFTRAVEACGALYVERGCREVLTTSVVLATPPEQRATLVARACGRAYCDLLPTPKPEHCVAEGEGLDALERNRRLADLHLSILTWELGVNRALRLLAPLGEVRDPQTGHGLFFTDERAPEQPGETQPQGGLDREVLRPVIASKAGEVRDCYERVLSVDPSLALGLATRFVIDAQGRVRRSFVVAATRRERALESCITNAQALMVFPEPKGGGDVWVTFPYVLIYQEP